MVSPAAAAPALRISSLSLTATNATIAGQVTTIDLRANAVQPAHFTIEIEAANLQMQTDSVEYFEAGETAVGTQEPNTQTTDFGLARVTAATQATETGLFIVPTGPLDYRATLSTAELSIPAESCRKQPSYFENDRPVLCTPTDQSVTAAGSAASAIELRGAFQVFLWGWQGRIDDATQSTEFWSGTTYSMPQNGVPLGPSELRHVVLFGNGTVVLHLPTDYSVEFLSSSLQLDATQATFVLTTGESIVQDAKLTVSRLGNHLATAVLGGAVTQPDGTMVVVGPAEKRFPWLPVAAVASLLAPVGVVISRSRSASRHVQYAKDSFALGNYHSAARHAEAALSNRKLGGQAGVLGAIALIRANDLLDAAYFVSELQRRGHTEPAAISYLEACIAAKSGEPARAVHCLKAAVAANPAYRAEAQANPILERAVQDISQGDPS